MSGSLIAIITYFSIVVVSCCAGCRSGFADCDK